MFLATSLLLVVVVVVVVVPLLFLHIYDAFFLM